MKYLLLISILCSYRVAKTQNLDNYFKIAVENNPGLQSQYKEFESALQKIPQIKTLPDPTFSIHALGQMTHTRLGEQRAKFSLSQMFPWFGTLKIQGDMMTFIAEAKYQEFIDARNQLYYQISAAYFPLYELKKWITIEKENIQILESYKSLAHVQFQNSKGAMVDVLRADIMLKDATTNLSILNQKKKPLETHFNKLLNRNVTEPIVITDTLNIPEIIHDYRKDSLLVRHPLLKKLDLKIKASEARQKVVIKQGMPKFGIGFDYIIIAPRTDVDIPQNGQDAYMPMLTVSLPIFRAKHKAAQKENRLIQESLALKKQDLTNRLIDHYQMNLFELQKQDELIRLYDEQIRTSQQSLKLLFNTYGNSGKDFEEVLRMQQQLLQYQKMKASALAAIYITLFEIEYITAKPR